MIKIICTTQCTYAGKLRAPGGIISIVPGKPFPRSKFKYVPHPDYPNGPEEPELPTGSGHITLLGNGPTLQKAINNGVKGKVAAINGAGARFPGKIHYWLSLHPDGFAGWRQAREEAGFAITGISYIAPRIVYDPPICLCSDQRSGGGSALYAAETLDIMGFTIISVIGVDLIDDGYTIMRKAWLKAGYPL